MSGQAKVQEGKRPVFVRVGETQYVYSPAMTSDEAVEVVPRSVADRYRDALGLLRGYIEAGEGRQILEDALWLGPRDENGEPIYA